MAGRRGGAGTDTAGNRGRVGRECAAVYRSPHVGVPTTDFWRRTWRLADRICLASEKFGGLERGQDFHDLDNFISPVKEIVGIGECRDRVKEYGESVGIKTNTFEKLVEAMNYINSVVESGDTVLLSPASASWDQYKQCEDRGDEFRDIVKELNKY